MKDRPRRGLKILREKKLLIPEETVSVILNDP